MSTPKLVAWLSATCPPRNSRAPKPCSTQIRPTSSAAGKTADCVSVVPREMPLLPPKYNNDAVPVIYDAVLAGKRFAADYRSRAAEADEMKSYEVSPIGLRRPRQPPVPRLHTLGLPRHPAACSASSDERSAIREDSDEAPTTLISTAITSKANSNTPSVP